MCGPAFGFNIAAASSEDRSSIYGRSACGREQASLPRPRTESTCSLFTLALSFQCFSLSTKSARDWRLTCCSATASSRLHALQRAFPSFVCLARPDSHNENSVFGRFPLHLMHGQIPFCLFRAGFALPLLARHDGLLCVPPFAGRELCLRLLSLAREAQPRGRRLLLRRAEPASCSRRT